jgi:uncharacterized protein YhbP (UPF0306 family)
MSKSMRSINGSGTDLLNDFLNNHRLMTLGTSDGLNIWNSSVNFLSDKWLNIYFVSGLSSDCADNVIEHPLVALDIMDGEDIFFERTEIQARGICEAMSEEKWPKILKLWNEKYKERELSIEDLKKHHLCLFKIVLIKLRYYDANMMEKVVEFDF